MKYTTARDSETAIKVERLYVYIGETKFTLTESVDGKLNIQKTNFDETELKVFPRMTNVIELH